MVSFLKKETRSAAEIHCVANCQVKYNTFKNTALQIDVGLFSYE